MPRRFRSSKTGLVVTVPDDASDEQIQAVIRRESQNQAKRAISANTARLKQPQASPQGPTPGAMPASGEARDPYYGPIAAFGGDVPFVLDPDTGQPIIDPARKAIGRALPSALLTGVGGALAGPGGAAAGAGAGEALTQALERILRASRGQEVGPSEDVLKDVALSSALGYAGEVVPPALIKGAGKVLAPFAKKITPRGLRAMKELEKVGVRPTPGAVSESPFLQTVESLTEAAFGGGKVRSARELAEEAGTQLLSKGLEKPGRAAQTMRVLGDRLDEMGSQVVLGTPETKRMAAKLLAERGLPKGDRFKTALEYMTGVETGDFNTLRQIRSDLLDLGRSNVTTSANERGAVRLLAKTLRREMDEGLSTVPPWSKEKAEYETLRQTWNRYNKASKVEYSRRDAQSLLEGVAIERKGRRIFQGKQLRDKLARLSPEDRAEYHPAIYDRLNRLSEVLSTVQAGQFDKAWSWAIRGSQLTAATSLAVGGLTGTGAVVLSFPRVAAWALTSPRTYRWLTTGLRTPETPAGRSALVMLIREYNREHPEEAEKEGYKAPWETE